MALVIDVDSCIDIMLLATVEIEKEGVEMSGLVTDEGGEGLGKGVGELNTIEGGRRTSHRAPV